MSRNQKNQIRPKSVNRYKLGTLQNTVNKSMFGLAKYTRRQVKSKNLLDGIFPVKNLSDYKEYIRRDDYSPLTIPPIFRLL